MRIFYKYFYLIIIFNLLVSCSEKSKFTLLDDETKKANYYVEVKPYIEHVFIKNNKPVIYVTIDNKSKYQIDLLEITISIYNPTGEKIIEGEANYIGLLYSNKLGSGDKSNILVYDLKIPDSNFNNHINLLDNLSNLSEEELKYYTINIEKWQLFEISSPVICNS